MQHHSTLTIHGLSPMNIALYVVLLVMLVVPLRAGDTTQFSMPFNDIWKQMSWPSAEYAEDMEGKVLVDLRIDTNGRIPEVRFISTAGDVVDTMFAKALRRIEGTPRRIDGKVVEVWFTQMFILRHSDGGKGLDAYENCFANYTRSLENDTTNSADKFYGRGRAHYLFGDIEAARHDFAIAGSLGNTKPWYEDFQTELVQRWLPTDTTNFDSLFYRAVLYGRYGLFDRAKDLYMRLSKMRPNATGPIRGLMLLFGNRRDYERASSMASVLLQHGGLLSDDLREACWWLYSAGRYDQAVAAGEMSMALAPDPASRSSVSVNYAIALLAQGQLDAARAEYKKILELHIREAMGDLKRHIRLGRPNSPFAREILMDVFHLDRDEIP